MTGIDRTRHLLACSALCLLACGANLGQADPPHYRWINERGTEVHSDRPPPPGIPYEVISSGTGLKRVVPGDEGAVPPEIEPRVGNEFTQVDENAAKKSKKNPELCERARTNLTALGSEIGVKIRDEKGEERFLTQEEIIVERAKAEAQAEVYCP